MGFRYSARAQKMPCNIVASCPSFREIKVLEDGRTQELLVPANKPLPSADVLKIKNVIDAGLPLERVNSKVLQPDFGDYLTNEAISDFMESQDNE